MSVSSVDSGSSWNTAAPCQRFGHPSHQWDPFFSLRALASYSSLSERMLRSFLRAPDHPLPHYRIGGRVVVRRSDFDRWVTVYREPATTADHVVSRLLADLDDPRKRPHAR